jgi:hypothetical protein
MAAQTVFAVREVKEFPDLKCRVMVWKRSAAE